MTRLLFCLGMVFSMNAVSADVGELYLGASFGYSKAPHNDMSSLEQPLLVIASTVFLIDNSESGGGVRGFFVGYQVSDWLAVELDHARVLDSSLSIVAMDGGRELGFVGASVEVDRLSFSVLPSYTLNQHFDVYGRFGYGALRRVIVTRQQVSTQSPLIPHRTTQGLSWVPV